MIVKEWNDIKLASNMRECYEEEDKDLIISIRTSTCLLNLVRAGHFGSTYPHFQNVRERDKIL